MAPRKDRVKPTHYPFLPFHAIRSAQLVSSIIVACIMIYFLRELSHDHYRLPWTFILLLAVSLLTILTLTATIVLHFFYGLNPLLNTVLNSSLLLLWTVSFALLSWWSSGTLRHICSTSDWDDTTGLSVCRLYKALFSFALFGLVSTILAVILDVHVQQGVSRKGKFTQVRMGDVDGLKSQIRVIQNDEDEGESNPNPMARGGGHRGGEGYAVPDEQFVYEGGMGYQGAAGKIGRQGAEGRI